MAKRRMLTVDFVDQDRFVELPDKAKLLYVYFATHADDECFVGSATKLMKIAGASKKMLQLLVDGGFLLRFESGVYLVVDWLVHNTIRKDRSTRTVYLYERSLVGVNPMGQYFLTEDGNIDDNSRENDNQRSPDSQPDDGNFAPQSRSEENIKEKTIKYKIITNEIKKECVPFGLEPAKAGSVQGETPVLAQAPSISDIDEYCRENHLNVDRALFYACYKGNGWIDGDQPLRDWKQALRIWDQSARNGNGL